MCILLSNNEHPDYSLILISNRDEVFQRKSLRMHEHIGADKKTTLMGVDQLGKGTWLCIDKEDKAFSVVMNVQSKPEIAEKMCSRGLLPLKMLQYVKEKNQLPTSFDEFDEYYEDLKNTRFFKLIYGNYANEELNYHLLSLADDNKPVYKNLNKYENFVSSNQYESDSQDFANDPWAKLNIGKRLIKQLNNVKKEEDIIEKCFEIAQHNTFNADNTPIEFQESKRKVRSSVFIPSHDVLINGAKYKYGTRTTTLILIKKDGNIKVIERERVCDDSGDNSFVV